MSVVRRFRHDASDVSSTDGDGPTAPAAGAHSARTGSTTLPRTRAGAAWVGACVAAVALLALIIFIAQNVHAVDVSFLALNGRFPLAVALLAAALAGSVITLVIGSTRIVQLRRSARRFRRERPTASAGESQPAG
jgi:lipopolysaccharide assembly protein A